MTNDLISRAAAIAAMAPMLRSMISRGQAVEILTALPAAQPAQGEVVAWRFKHMHLPHEWKFAENPHRGKPWVDFEPLYAHPPAPPVSAEGEE